MAAHGGDAEGDVSIQLEPQFLRSLQVCLRDVHLVRKPYLSSSYAHSDIYIEDGFGRLDERNGGQETG